MSLERGVVELTRGLYTFMIHMSSMSSEVCIGKINACITGTFSFTGEKLMIFASMQSWILDSIPWIMDSRYWIPYFYQWNLDSGFQLLVWFRIPKPRILDSTSKNFPNSKILITLHTWGNDVKRRLHRCHVCTINPLDKRSNVCIVKILWSKLDEINIGVLTSVLTIFLWSVTIPDVRAVVIIAVRYAITATPVNIHKILRRRDKKNFGPLSPYLRKENND